MTLCDFKLIRIIRWFTFLKKPANDRATDIGTVTIINHRYSMKYVDDRGLMRSFDANMLTRNEYHVRLGCWGRTRYETHDKKKKETSIEILKRLHVLLITLLLD